MKTTHKLLSLFVAVLGLMGCNLLSSARNLQLVKPSNTIITEERSVSGFTGIDMSAFGRLVITQGDNESLTIKGSDNILPLIKTSVSNGVLTIRMQEGVTISGMNEQNVLTFTLSVKDLNKLTNSGLSDVEMDTLSTTNLDVNMSGAGQVTLAKLTADSLNISISGLGSVEMSGEANQAKIEISGAGSVKAPDLKIKTADVTISGLGSAEIWVTDRLTGDISSAGDVSYYGNPQTDTKNTGLGKFTSLGNK